MFVKGVVIVHLSVVVASQANAGGRSPEHRKARFEVNEMGFPVQQSQILAFGHTRHKKPRHTHSPTIYTIPNCPPSRHTQWRLAAR